MTLKVCRVQFPMAQLSKWPTGGHFGDFYILAIPEVNSYGNVMKFNRDHPLITLHDIYNGFLIILKIVFFTNFFLVFDLCIIQYLLLFSNNFVSSL